ncbi:hypothetical protein TVAG_389720 [Trichomonas vaginalis G3]|uniref:Chromo shadow domain-containing protein n=1 Tax=Trichomonas vaginalis (strain ATCC PRA-98 / G3) TaxID=412133 RepID=A2E174_TRIV3|nr:chromo domain-like family [Trichomonas vaginalis G3]EAY13575.1 hypothetical protein TVAG_389720 [Trichomonas vaginalis G3]KAI5486405.1 chromo domain-like family [Trichomonas vaginalis G3]|eukprot:XP_001325798.1 hypothetical protein [Trichomonas vaginalis G3]
MSEHEPVAITKTRKRNGVTQYFVIYSDTKDGKGQWVKETDLKCQSLIEQFEGTEIDKKKVARKPSATPPRRIQKIAGAMEINNEIVFLVKFTDSENFENVSHADMKSRYTKSLLAYYEQHIFVVDE